MKQLETIEDSALDNVVGGLGFNLSVDSMSGISATTPLGSIEIANPFTVAKNLIGGVSSKLRRPADEVRRQPHAARAALQVQLSAPAAVSGGVAWLRPIDLQ